LAFDGGSFLILAGQQSNPVYPRLTGTHSSEVPEGDGRNSPAHSETMLDWASLTGRKGRKRMVCH